MADFDYVAIDPRGNEARGHVAATDMDAARAALDRRRLYVVRIEPGSAPAARGRPLFGLELGRAKMSGKQLTLFTRQLATLNRVSPLEESLRTITRQTEQYNWDFVFLGANQDAVLTARDLGIGRDSALTYDAGADGVRGMSRSTSRYMRDVRAKRKRGFDEGERGEARGA